MPEQAGSIIVGWLGGEDCLTAALDVWCFGLNLSTQRQAQFRPGSASV